MPPPASNTSPAPSGSDARAAARSETRKPTCLNAPVSLGPSASKSVSLPRRAFVPMSVNFSSFVITCMLRWRSRNATMVARSSTQKAT